MVLVGLTGDASMNPKEVAGFSEKNGYYTENGTSWELMTQGAQLLGLEAEELPLDEDRIKQALEQGQPIICSMGPGDFTTQGHFIVLTGVDADGRLLLNDPNSRKNSEKAWEYERLKGQIKNLWKYSYQGT
jgi:ABC-type bacteriocin/lantibiotic exporter with double-glycine peptidase domain